MLLDKISIYNFRSIKELELKPEPKCQIFVGEIEAGKSNILKAISYLAKDLKPKKKDIREPSDGENIEDSYIDFDFCFTEEEHNSIYNNFKDLIYNPNEKSIIVNSDKNKLNLTNLLKTIMGYIRVDFIDETKTTNIFNLPNVEIESNWRIVPTKQETLLVKNIKQNKEIDISKFKIVNTEDLDIPNNILLEKLTIEHIKNLVNDFVVSLVNKKIPNVIFWEYNEKNLLPSKVNLKNFCEDPTICKPLKAMFDLQGIDNIKNQITEAKEKNRNSLRNLLKRVAKTTIKHFQSVWPDYKNVEFSLEPDGEDIIIAIRDTYNDYDLSDRSDGFKRFVTFLLLISAKNKSNILTDSIIIVDEPEISLHIKGQRYLRDELINISKNNIVFYSTHSIFMIDKNNIDRHYIVKKQKEITDIKQVDKSNYMDEEVILNALGYSIFEALREFNIIFEGWTDKKLYEISLNKIPPVYKNEINSLKEYGTCFSNGVKEIKPICSILDLIPRKYIVLSDSDKPAKEKQKDFSQYMPGIWYRYDEIYNKRRIITSEDFIKINVLYSELSKLLKTKKIEKAITEQDIMLAPNGRIKLIEDKLNQAGIEKTVIKEILHDLKENIFTNLKSTQIEDDYYEFLTQLVTLIQSLK